MAEQDTTNTQPPDTLPYLDFYQFSIQHSAEQEPGWPEAYLTSKPVARILRRLTHTKGNMIAVIANQGMGKGTTQRYLQSKLHTLRKKVVSIKWQDLKHLFDKIPRYITHEFYDEQLNERLLRANKPIPYFQQENAKERLLGTQETAKLRLDAIIIGLIENEGTILIDFPDYDKRSRGQMLRDLKEFQTFWVKLCSYDGFESVNVIFFWQKELWGGHFSFGKWDVFELKPFTPIRLADWINENWDHPFQTKALETIANLARGVPRWFKKYIMVCLDCYYDQLDTFEGWITEDHVKKWITLDHLVDDWNRELMEVFPKNKGSRRKAVEVFKHLQEYGKTTQAELQELYYGPENSDKMRCSRVLAKLEEHGYINRAYDGREKAVEMVFQYE